MLATGLQAHYRALRAYACLGFGYRFVVAPGRQRVIGQSLAVVMEGGGDLQCKVVSLSTGQAPLLEAMSTTLVNALLHAPMHSVTTLDCYACFAHTPAAQVDPVTTSRLSNDGSAD